MDSQKPIVALTMGDPAGIGPELGLAALRDPKVLTASRPVLFGDASVALRVSEALDLPMPEIVVSLQEWDPSSPVPALVDCGVVEGAAISPGKVQAACGHAAYEYIRLAVEQAMSGAVAAVATAPINKEALSAAGIGYPGHTEILAALTGSPRVCMMLASDKLIVSMATTHIGISDVSGRLSRERVFDVIELTAKAVARLLEKTPRLGVCGLNPHAGEHGLFGRREEEESIIPAMSEARRLGIDVEGPIPPDTAFVAHRRARFDAIVTMYHDQGHIPFKMLAFDTGVNITLGLPIVRVSVDHGTAFDIAWQSRADLTSMRQAVLYAARMSAGSANG